MHTELPINYMMPLLGANKLIKEQLKVIMQLYL